MPHAEVLRRMGCLRVADTSAHSVWVDQVRFTSVRNSMKAAAGGHNGYVRILHDSNRLVERLARHLSGQGLASLPAEIESLRSIGRIMIRRIYASNAAGMNVTFVHSSVSQLERALTAYERVIISTPNEVGLAMKLHDSIRQQIEYLCSIAESLDRGESI